MLRKLVAILMGTALFAAGSLARADDKTSKPEIKGGIEGKIKSVDVESKTLTITTTQGRDQTFQVTDDTVMVGPRGGKVRRHLKDPRFHEGFPVTIVADRKTATEVHLGYAKDASDEPAVSKPKSKSAQPAATNPIKREAATKQAEEDDEAEVLGHVKSFDSSKRILVITLLNGNTRSFILAKSTPVVIQGKESKEGIEDPALKTGAAIIVITDEGGRKVKELKISEAKARKAG
jgi:hypothetical protein